MVLLQSENIPLGTPAPDFKLRSVDGKQYSLADFSSAKVLVLMFICNHCPYVKAVEERILQLSREYGPEGVQFVGICANDPSQYPEDRPEALLKRWKEKQYAFPYLIDESQDTAKAYRAVCTPDIYVFDAQQRLAYHGRIDDNWQDARQVTKRELAQALDRLLIGQSPEQEQWPSMGCSIKWR